jgi:ubiquinone/menaquinone biosynthesis C-methylase UbiE
MLSRFLHRSSSEPLTITMSGIKLGDRLLVLGAADHQLIAALATKAGLTGRTVVIDADAGRTEQAATAVEREGALIEPITAPWGMLPLDPDSFDVVVLRDVLAHVSEQDRARAVQEAHRVLRPGGRCLVIDGARRGGLGALFRRGETAAAYASGGGASATLGAHGFRGTRTLAERDGIAFTEGIKPAS